MLPSTSMARFKNFVSTNAYGGQTAPQNPHAKASSVPDLLQSPSQLWHLLECLTVLANSSKAVKSNWEKNKRNLVSLFLCIFCFLYSFYCVLGVRRGSEVLRPWITSCPTQKSSPVELGRPPACRGHMRSTWSPIHI